MDTQALNVKVVLLVLSVFISGVAFSHDFFFAFAEVEYNDVSQRLEGTITVTTHDLELALQKQNILLKELDPKELTKEELKSVESYIFDHFSITQNTKAILHIIGFESLLNGISNFYFESETMEFSGTAEITFDLLMDQFADQQNKISFIYRDRTRTLTFLPTETFKNLIFSDEE